jgi:peptide/nickel transport system permease protein
MKRALEWQRMPLLVKCSFCVVALLVFLACAGPLLPLADPYAQDIGKGMEMPSAAHLLGTDQLGRDLLSRIVAGSRFSTVIGLGAVSVGLLVGVPFGVFAGFYGRWLDVVFARTIDILLAFPGIILALAVVAVTGPGVSSLIFAVGLRTIPVFARVARAETISLRPRDFVEAARALGCRPYQIMAWHILPNIIGPLTIVSSLESATAILIGATLSFLGVGISPEVPEWGAMISAGRPYMMRYPYLVVAPGTVLMLAMAALNIIGDYLRDRMDPRSSKGRLLG